MSRAYTEVEAREMLLKHIAALARYWAAQPGKTPLEKCNGLAFSILSTLDGDSIGWPVTDLILCPQDEDKADAIADGLNWFQPGMAIGDSPLHESWHRFAKKE